MPVQTEAPGSIEGGLVAGRADAIAARYRLLLSGKVRYAEPDPVGDLFDYEIGR